MSVISSRGGKLWIAFVGAVVVAAGVIVYLRSSTPPPAAWERSLGVSARATEPIALRFGSPDAPGLVTEYREVLYDPDPMTRAKYAVHALLEGPTGSNRPIFNASSRVRAVYLDGGGVVVDFAGSPLLPEASEAVSHLAIVALLRVLTDRLGEMNPVVLLVDGEPLGDTEERVAVPREIHPQSWLPPSERYD